MAKCELSMCLLLMVCSSEDLLVIYLLLVFMLLIFRNLACYIWKSPVNSVIYMYYLNTTYITCLSSPSLTVHDVCRYYKVY